MSQPRKLSLEAWLVAAYKGEAGCPTPETIHRGVIGELAADDLAVVERHIADCPSCSAERDLAALFEAPPIEVVADDVTAIVDELRRRSPLRDARAAGARSSGQEGISWLSRVARAPAWSYALAALLVLAFGVTFQSVRIAQPPLPEPTSSEQRGGRVEIVGPVGDTGQPLSVFRWAPLDGASSFRVTLTTVDDVVLWEETAVGTEVRLPVEVIDGIRARVVYLWRVDALDQQGGRIAESEWVRIRWIPPQFLPDLP